MITFLLPLVILASNALHANCQGNIRSGIAYYKFLFPDSSSVNAPLLENYNKECTVYFNDVGTRIEYNNQDSIVGIIESKSKDIVTLYPQNLAVKISSKEIQFNLAMLFDGYDVIETNESKYISGYKCNKSIVTYKSLTGNERKIEIWSTIEIVRNTRHAVP